jgi:MFS transporter, OCT family, solute carrier family 22 (organic cation transporter), member 4/5
MIGKFGISVSYAVVYVFSAEIYPTVVRNAGMGISSMSARVGGALAPFILLFVRYFNPFKIQGTNF